MANSFSQQLKAKSTQQQQGRLTRTQRQVVEQEKQKQQRFEQLRSQAQAISENVFVEKDVTEKYYEYVPKSYLDRKGNITRDWQRMSEKNKRNIIKNTSARDLVSFERTRTYKDPFTFEEYKTEYSKLNPELQQFFTSPQEITSTEKAKITAKIDVWKAQIEERKQKIAQYQASWSSKSKSYREKHRESYREKIRKYNDDIEEYQDRISELESKSGEIEKGYKAEDLIEYAYSKADYRRSRQEARQEAKTQFQKDLESGNLDKNIEQLNKFRGIGKSGLTYEEYSRAVERYNKEVEYKQGLQKYAEKVGGFENLPQWAKERLNPEAVKFQAENPSEKLFFDTSGNVKGVESGALQMSVAGTEAYSEKIKEQQDRDKKLREEAKIQLAGLSGMQITEKPEDKTWWQKLVTGVKAGYLSSQLGISTKLPETTVAGISAERQQGTRDLFKIDSLGDLVQYSAGVPVYKIGTVPYESSLQAIERKEASDYRAKQKAIAIEELDKLVANAPDELKPYIQEEGISILQEKGIRFKRTETTLTLADPDFQRRISENIYDFEKEMKEKDYLGVSLVGLRFASSEALKVYATGKAFKYVTKGIGTVGSKIFSGSLGGFSIEGLKTSGGIAKLELTPTTISRGQKIAYNIGKGTIYAGAIGLTGYQKYQSLKYYQRTSEYGNILFGIETFGQSVGLGLLIRDELNYKRDIDNLNKQVQRENELLLKKQQSVKNIKEYGQFSEKATTTYEQAGVGKEVKLNEQQLKIIAKDYAKVTGVSEDEAFYILKEKSIYRTTLSVKDSQVPSIERQLQFQRTGIADAGDDVYRVSRYGFTDKVQTPEGVKEYAFEFNIRGNKISRLQLKTTLATDEYALTNVFEKARYSYKTPEQILKLKETVLTKATKISTANVGEVKITLSDTENRLLLKSAYGSERFSLKEALNIGLSDGQLDDIAGTWQRTGLDARKLSQFKSLRFETPLFKGGDIKIATEGEYQFLQVGVGKRDLVLKDIIYNLKKSGFFNEMSSITKKTSTPIYSPELFNNEIKNILADTSIKNLGFTPQTQVVQGSLKNIQISPTISSFDVSTKVQLKETIKSMNNLGVSLLGGLATQTLSGQAVKSYSKSRQDLQQKALNINAERLRQDLGLKQITQQSMKTQQISTILSPTQFPLFNAPTFNAPTYTPPKYINYAKIKLDQSALKKKVRGKVQQKRITELGLLPDFTSRAIGLSPQEFSIKDVNKAVRKLQTGFEIRTGGRIKGITEKNLMKEVMLKL